MIVDLPTVHGQGAMLHFTIYRHPLDFPDQYVLRAHLVTREGTAPLDWIKLTPTWPEMQKWRQSLANRGLVSIPRMESDHPSVVETWI